MGRAMIALMFVVGCNSTTQDGDTDNTSGAVMSFFYQTVEPGINNIYPGISEDGAVVDAYGVSVMAFDTSGDDIDPYGDPTFSRLANGRWAMMSATGKDHPQGVAQLLYHEAACPQVVDEDMLLLQRSSAAGCASPGKVLIGKASQIFEYEGDNWVFMDDGEAIHLARFSDTDTATTDLTSLCYLASAPTALSEIDVGEAVPVIAKAGTGLLISDVAIARRKDGTWVLFIKAIPDDSGCTGGSRCELCTRGVYRSTSTDLLTWSAPEAVATGASMPDATVDAQGRVWIYWQDFSEACATESDAEFMAATNRAGMSGMYEVSATEFSDKVTVSIPGETFETDTSQHYPTNPNPIALPDAAARSALDACLD